MIVPAVRGSVLDLALPQIEGRDPYTVPTRHLAKSGDNAWGVVAGRRSSKAIVVDRIRAQVDAWRNAQYPNVSVTTARLLRYWFEEEHPVPGAETFRFYFGQREAVETIIFLYEVAGIRDVSQLLAAFCDPAAEHPVSIREDDGRLILRRYVSELGREVEQDLPRRGLNRVAVKMATGSGKTAVMALTMTWSYFHQRFEAGSLLANNFLVIAPNVIVFERLQQDFADSKIFKDLPLIPPEWSDQWDVHVITRGQSQQPGSSGNIVVTNIQQLYEAHDDDSANPVAQLVGPPPATQPHPPVPLLDRIKTLSRLMVLNDEAHHLHEDTLKWNETLLGLDTHLTSSGGLTAWLDFSATPKNQHGTYFPWIVSDYPLAQAVEDRIVKTPLIIHQTDKADPDKYSHDEAGDAFNEWIAVAVARWREHVRDYGAVGERPVLFVMAETTKEADSIAARLEREGDLRDRVLTLHVNERGGQRGEISDRDLRVARQAARDIDNGTSKYRAVVSVLMLREGWDVRNVSVILGLRPFSAKANILPEQAIGRGLRLMRAIPRGSTQILELIGTHAFESFVRELEREGLGVGTEAKPPPPPTLVVADPQRAQYDIAIPRTTSLFEREYKNLETLQPNILGPLVDAKDLEDNARQQIQLLHGTVDVKVHEAEVAFEATDVPPLQNVLASITNRVMRRARLGEGFRTLYPIVRRYVRDYCFGRTVDSDSLSVRRALDDGAVIDGIAGLFARHIGDVTVEKRVVKVVGPPLRLSETKEFLWRRMTSTATKTIFSAVACFNSFEADFADFLDKSSDVRCFAKLCEWFTEFHVQYIKSSGALGSYYPDFVVVQAGTPETNWIVETKGHEDAEVPSKDAQMTRWCEDVSKETGASWRYLKVPYRLFYDLGPQSLNELVTRLGSASAQLVMPPRETPP